MDKIGLASFLYPTQTGAAVRGVASLLGSLNGCSSPAGMSGLKPLWKDGDQVCYTYEGSNYPVKLLEDVMPDQMTAMVEMPDGSKTSVSVDWLSDISNCMR